MVAESDYWTPAFQLMLDEARRSIDRQSERLQDVRHRAVALVGFGSIVAAALGLGSEDLTLAGAIAVLAFVAVVAASLFVLVPREFRFELSAVRMRDWFDEPARDVGQMVWWTAMLHDEHHTSNHGKLKHLQAAIAIGVAALFIETLALVARLVL